MEKKFDVKKMVEDIIGCKWSLQVIDLISQGIIRPGEMVRNQEGLTTKVLNERLTKLSRYGIVEKIQYAEIPPRVEYCFTERGRKFIELLERIKALQMDFDSV